MKTQISLAKLSGLVVPTTVKGDSRLLTYTLNTEMMRLGYVMSKELFECLSNTEPGTVYELCKEVVPIIQKMKGADVKYQSFYPNFPKQVMEASGMELYFNAMIHYWSYGTWKPEYKKEIREFAPIGTKLKSINLIEEDVFMDFFGKLLRSNDSLSESDKETVEWYMDTYEDLVYPDIIPYKETLCMVAVKFLAEDKDITGLVKTSTDILRIASHLSGGDVSLAENTKFKSLPRKLRRSLVSQLDRVISEEDIKRHKNKWGKLFHNLHVCEYSKKVCEIATKVRSNKRLYSTLGAVEKLLLAGDFKGASKTLVKRPGEFARRLDHLLRDTLQNDGLQIVNEFIDVAPKVSTRVLTQVLGHFGSRVAGRERVVFPKGSLAKAQMIPATPGEVLPSVTQYMFEGVRATLNDRFAELDPLGKVWIDPTLKGCPLPAAQRSASEGLDLVARGTRLPIGDDNTLRLFIYWVGQDIDLSATLHDKDFNPIGRIAYTNLREKRYEACHSGDITSARNGASEFIDITMDKLMEHDIQYVVMNVLVYSGPNFDEHEKCYAGWMTRSKPQSNEIYEPRKVKSKVDLTCQSQNAIPVVFDMATKESIWCDLTTRRNTNWGGNNVESNFASIRQILTSIVNLHNKFTLYDLFLLHAKARGEVVETREEAETVFAIEDGIGPRDINTINADYLV